MSDIAPNIPTDAKGNTLDRAMGKPMVSDSIILGSATKYVDIFDLSDDEDRAFTMIHIYNPHATLYVHVSIGPEFSDTKHIVVPPQSNLIFDEQTFGMRFGDARVRAKLNSATGTLATGAINYHNGGTPVVQPADGDTVTINGFVYEFSNDASKASSSDKIVAIGGAADTSWSNLVAAVNAFDQAVTASINTGTDIVTITSNYGGTYGNSIAMSTAISGVVIDATLSTGAGGVTPIIHIA